MQLAQKYRPRKLSEIVGHRRVIEELKRRAKEENWPQAIYLTSKTGVGKTTLARIIAKHLVCQHPTDKAPCNECKTCRDIDLERFQLTCLECNASNIGIEEMRALEEQSSFKSLMGKHKVFIIDELQELCSGGGSIKAQKNLLKILEKKQKHSFFILGSMDDSKVDQAVRNRCIMYRLHQLTPSEIMEYLTYICKEEKIVLDENKASILSLISENAQGSMRTAIALFERCLYSDLWDTESIQKELGLYAKNDLTFFCLGLLRGDPSIFDNERHYSVRFLSDLISILIRAYHNSVVPTKKPPTNMALFKDFRAFHIFSALEKLISLRSSPDVSRVRIQFELLNLLEFYGSKKGGKTA